MVVIPEGITAIGVRAFSDCKEVTGITFPQGVAAISAYAFAFCDALQEIHFPNEIELIPEGVCCCCNQLTKVTLPKHTTAIGSHAFDGCRALTTVEIPEGVTELGDFAFRFCTSLTEIVIPKTVHTLAGQAFAGCVGLTSVKIPSTITSIGWGAFQQCKNITEITLPDSITSLPGPMFEGCDALEHVVLPNTISAISHNMFADCSALEKIDIPEGVTCIAKNAFRGCTELKQVKLPQTLTYIGESAFAECKQLTEMIIPAAVEKIENYALASCAELEAIILEGNKVSLPAAAIFDCKKLKTVQFAENYFTRREKCGATMIPFMRPVSIKESACLWMFQDDKWLAWVQQQKPDVNLLAEEILEILREEEKLTPKLITRLIDLITWGYPAITSERVQAICDAVAAKDEKAAKKLQKNEDVQKGLSGERIIEEEEPIETFALSLLEKRPLHPSANIFTKGIPYAGKTKRCTPQLLNILVSEYLYLYDQYHEEIPCEFGTTIKLSLPTTIELPEGPEQIAACLDKEELSQVLENQISSCTKNYRPWMYAYARFATEESVKKILRSSPGGTASKARYWHENMDEAILLSETKAAADHLEKKGSIDRYARMRNMSLQEFRDKHSLPKWNMDEKGVIRSEFGRLGFVLTSDFALRPMELESGKELRSVSAKTDPDAAQEFKALKKEVADFYKKRTEYIRSIYITAEEIAISHWMETYCGNPILRPITEKVIWSDASGEVFMLDHGVIHTIDGIAYEPRDFIRIAHVLDMTAEQIKLWQDRLLAAGTKLLIEQVWEPIATVQSTGIYRDAVLTKEERNEFKRALGRKAISVKSENDYSEFDHHANRYVFSDTGTMQVGKNVKIEYRVNEQTGETTLLSVRCPFTVMTRELNAIFFELSRVCVKSVIRQDAVAELSTSLTAQFTAAQISEFIRLAQDCGSVNATVMLLEYKQTHFADVDPLAEFTLD
jgi:hypothetical protein